MRDEGLALSEAGDASAGTLLSLPLWPHHAYRSREFHPPRTLPGAAHSPSPRSLHLGRPLGLLCLRRRGARPSPRVFRLQLRRLGLHGQVARHVLRGVKAGFEPEGEARAAVARQAGVMRASHARGRATMASVRSPRSGTPAEGGGQRARGGMPVLERDRHRVSQCTVENSVLADHRSVASVSSVQRPLV